MVDKSVGKVKRESWKKFTKEMKEKGQESDREELIVHCLSAEVHGKAQKYSRVGPRVPCWQWFLS
jgi:hypothetical protein